MHIVTVHVIENNTKTFAGYASVAKDPWTYGDMMVKSYLEATGGVRTVEYIMEVLWEGASRPAIYEDTYTVYKEEDTEEEPEEEPDYIW